MSHNMNANLIPTNSHSPMKVLIIARISTNRQDEKSLADQVAFCRNWLEKNLQGTYEIITIETSELMPR